MSPKAVEDAGATGFTMINTLVGTLWNGYSQANYYQWSRWYVKDQLSLVALKLIRQVPSFRPSIIGMGGVDSAEAAIEMFIAGASAIGVGTITSQIPHT